MLLLLVLALGKKDMQFQFRWTNFSPSFVQNSIKANMRLYQVGTF